MVGIEGERKPPLKTSSDDIATYREERLQFFSQPGPQRIQEEIVVLGEQINQEETQSSQLLETLRQNLEVYLKKESDLREKKESLQNRIAFGEKTRRPTGADFATEVAIIWGRIQMRLGRWQRRPPNLPTKILGRAFSFLTQETHPLISQTERQLTGVTQAKETHQTEISKFTGHSGETIAKLASEKQAKERALEGLLENWALQDFQRLVFYLLENQVKIPDLVARYGREQVKNPTQREILTYLFWNLQVGFALGRENGDFDRWLRHFLPQRKKEDWQIPLTIANWEELGPALRENLDNFTLLLGQNPKARRDFADFLEWRIKEALARQGGVGQPSIPKPYFVKELPTSGLVSSEEHPPEELRPSFSLLWQGKRIHPDEELREVIANLIPGKQNPRQMELLVVAIQKTLEDFGVQRGRVRGFKILRWPVGEANSRIRAGQWRILTRKHGDGIEIISIEPRGSAY